MQHAVTRLANTVCNFDVHHWLICSAGILGKYNSSESYTLSREIYTSNPVCSMQISAMEIVIPNV
jgi:hypothetical protein